MDNTFVFPNKDELEKFFDVVKTIDFEQLREAIQKVEEDMKMLSTINKRIMNMNDDDIMWDSENQRIKINIKKSQEERVSKEIYCANLGAFNSLVIDNCKLGTNYREYPEFWKMIVEYIEMEKSDEPPSVITLINGLVETLRKRYDVELKNFMQIEELQKIGPKRREMIAKLMFCNNTENQTEANGVTSPASTTQQSDIGPR